MTVVVTEPDLETYPLLVRHPEHCSVCSIPLGRFNWEPGTNLCRGCRSDLQAVVDRMNHPEVA